MEEKNPFDVLVYMGQTDIDAADLDIPFLLYPSEDLSVDTLVSKLDNYRSPLFILDQMSLALVDEKIFALKHITIVNLFVGISSMVHKVSPELTDISAMLHKDFQVCEPYDLWNLLQHMDGQGKKYIRLHGLEMPSKLLQDEHEKVDETKILSMDKFGFGGEEATILTSGNYLWSLIQTIHILNEQEKFFDLYAILDYSAPWSDLLKKSVMRSEKLIVVLDQKKDAELEKKFSDTLAALGNFSLDFIYPTYSGISSVLDEFRPDQAGFDQVGLMSRILHIIAQ